MRSLAAAVVSLLSVACLPALGQSTEGRDRAHADFAAWMERHQTAHTPQTRQSLENDGVQLARARRAWLKKLIRTEPRRALEFAVDAETRKGLPAAVRTELETPVAGIGCVGPLRAPPCDDKHAAPSVSLTVKGQVFRAFLHGRQLQQRNWWKVPVEGVAVDNWLVLRDSGPEVAAPALVKREVTVRHRFGPGDIQIQRKDGFDYIWGADMEMPEDEPGMPWLPVKHIQVAIPSGARVRNIKADSKEVEWQRDILPYPVQPPLPKQPGIRPVFVPPKAAAYAADARTPAAVAVLTGEHNQLGFASATLRINPVRYHGPSRTLYRVTKVTVTLECELPPVKPSVGSRRQSQKFAALAEQSVVNPDEVESPVVADAEAPSPDTVDYLIITTNTLAASFNALATHRQSYNGFATEIVSVADIYTNYAGADAQAKIRACIIDYVTTRNTSHVVLGGDNTIVPDRDCFVYSGSYTNTTMPTDLYYAGLDSIWDEDEDGIYGEANTSVGDEGDLLYDVLVGRIPVRTAAHADAYINKVIAYDNAPPYHLARKFIMTGKMLGDSYTNGPPTDYRPSDAMNDGHLAFRDDNHPTVSDSEMWVRRMFRDRMQAYGFQATQIGCLCDTLTSWDTAEGGSYAASAANMVTRFGEGWNFVISDTHGSTSSISADGGSFGTSNASSLTNLTVIFYTGACLSGGFDSGEPSLSEAMLRNASGGALVYLGCSRYGWYSPDTPPASNTSTGGTSANYMRKFLELVFKNKMLDIGTAFSEHKKAYASSSGNNGATRWVQFGLNLQGDPALRMIGVVPDVIVEATDPSAAEPGANTGQFQITRIGPTNTPLSVAYTRGGSAVYGADYGTTPPTSTSGFITIPAGSNSVAVVVTPLDDTDAEADETVTFQIGSSTNYAFGLSISASATIADNNDAALPIVNLIATGPLASEWPVSSGTIVATRTGDTNNALTVYYDTGGTASNGLDYLAIPSSVTLSAGVASAEIVITPYADSLAEGNESARLSILPNPLLYAIGINTNATVTIADKPVDDWRWDNFGPDANNPAIAGDAADPDGDGIPNLAEYGMGLDPKTAGAIGQPTASVTNDYLTFSYRENKQATDVTYNVEACSNLASNSWSSTGLTELSRVDSNTFWYVTIRDNVPINSATNRFMRLRITRP